MYVKKQDYFDFAGIDLDIELRGGNVDNVSKKVEIFLKRTEEWLLDYLEMFYTFSRDNSDNDENALKQAILHQIDYVLRNGDDDKVVVIAPKAFHVLKMAGLCNAQREAYKYGYRY